MIVRVFKVIFYFLLGIFSFSLVALTFQYVINPKYTFPEPRSFNGEYLYNPYKGMDSTKWQMANFHVHSKIDHGLTNGTANTNQFINRFYTFFGYKIIGISDYQHINTYENKNKWFIPAYEHGYQYYKTHHLVLNAKKVSWLDYFFYQTISNKQTIIDQLKKDTAVIVAIDHPVLRQAFSINDFKYLSNFNCLEIANNQRVFRSFYDTILSAGHAVFIMADDDAHDLTKISEGCHSFNLVNTDLVGDSILHSIKTGRSVGVNFNVSSFKTNEEKKTVLQKLPKITSVNLKNDTLCIRLNKPVKSIKFIGQQGVGKKILSNCTIGTYSFSKRDTYIRTEIECQDGTFYFLNPVFRYDGVRLPNYISSYDAVKTWLWRSIVLIVLIMIFLIRKYNK